MKLASYIDHTILKPDATKAEVLAICEEAITYGFASVCVNQYYTSLVAETLKGSGVLTCTVVGFPLGAVDSVLKAYETSRAIEEGSDEIDMVINVGALKDGNWSYVRNDIQEVVQAAKGKTVKVILETCLLTDEAIVKACTLALEAGAHFVKTSTGFSKGGATIHHVALMKQTVQDKAQVKASGGIRDLATATAMIEAGATRLGASAGVSIMQGLKSETDY